jgi:hypothetical protein
LSILAVDVITLRWKGVYQGVASVTTATVVQGAVCMGFLEFIQADTHLYPVGHSICNYPHNEG